MFKSQITSKTPQTENRSAIEMNPIEIKMSALAEPPFKKVKQQQKEPEESSVKINDLPELPFEKILGYLSLNDLIRSRAVSRRWRSTIDGFRAKSLCFSELQITEVRFIREKNWLADGEFAQNFIGLSKFRSFFQAFRKTIFCNLKHLRLCDLSLIERDSRAFF